MQSLAKVQLLRILYKYLHCKPFSISITTDLFWIGGLPITSKMVFQVTGLVILSIQSCSTLQSLTSSCWLELLKHSRSPLLIPRQTPIMYHLLEMPDISFRSSLFSGAFSIELKMIKKKDIRIEDSLIRYIHKYEYYTF